MDSHQVRQKYIDFFVKRGHKQIPSAPLVPENDPTTLFNSSGMQPLVPYLLGQPHPQGKRLVNSQKSFRAQDIDEVGDNRHTTFFEMLGNWSLGDYFKSEQLPWIFEFLTQELGLPKENLAVTVFAGDKHVPRDLESAKIWQKLGIPEKRIFYYDVHKNWWSRSGIPSAMPPGEPGGPDSEVFYEFQQVKHNPKFGKVCHPNCDCGRFLEIANSVFMQYQKQPDGSLKELAQKNVDFGGGLERLVAATNNDPDVFNTDLFQPLMAAIESTNRQAARVVADHLKASVFLIADGVVSSNKAQGYVLRRLIRRSLVKLSINLLPLVDSVFDIYKSTNYFSHIDPSVVKAEIGTETAKFKATLQKGLKLIGKISPFDLFQTYGFPPEITAELYAQKNLKFDWDEFRQALEAHQQKSRTASAGMFKGGLADHSEKVIKLHTATHLLNQALRQVLGEHIKQQGSNITADRLRFDFTHPQAITPEEIKKIETLINKKIQEDLPVHHTMEPKDQALKSGALAFFRDKYADTVSVYTIGKDHNTNWFSKELCGGPHVTSTGVIGPVRIKKTESIGGGMRRIYAVLEPAHQIKSSQTSS